jgi:hypothetical protein
MQVITFIAVAISSTIATIETIREVPSELIFARKQTRDKQDGKNYIECMLQRNMVKYSYHRLKYLVLYYKRVI